MDIGMLVYFNKFLMNGLSLLLLDMFMNIW